MNSKTQYIPGNLLSFFYEFIFRGEKRLFDINDGLRKPFKEEGISS